ncbi:hypothetical protein LTR09_010103 [Extremus antarcticus]|uniref:Uncharacterized protein n=1 Tax=Extremus antarcticus TaxID=702011 RepID=A0AAJ0G8Q2_9PEZI|nr:hypothetical protein LTR09_010103 [Extremus antarcticus]
MLLSADRGVGPWLASFVEALPEGPNVRWQDYVLEVALPEPGSHGMGVSQGVPPFNYDLYLHHSRAAVSLVAAATQRSGRPLLQQLDQASLVDIIAHRTLRYPTYSKLTELRRSSLNSQDDLNTIAGLLGTVFYFMGGAAGGAAVAASISAGVRAGATAARVGVSLLPIRSILLLLSADNPVSDIKLVKGARNQANQISDAATKATVLSKLDAAEANALTAASAGSAAGNFGASTYMIGGTFNAIDLSVEDEIEGADLAPVLSALVTTSQVYLAKMGRLAAGHANEGEDYNDLPGQQGSSGIYPNENAIAYFYSDGKMLVEESDPTFNATMKGAFDSFRSRVVDMAMKSGFRVWANKDLDDEASCIEYGEYGAVWSNDLCLNLWQHYETAIICQPDGGSNTCYDNPMSEDQCTALVDEFGMDAKAYMQGQVDCAKSGGATGEPDTDELPLDGAVPACWYSVKAIYGTMQDNGFAEPGYGTFHIETEDW